MITGTCPDAAAPAEPRRLPRPRSRLTDEQLCAVAATESCVFIEAAPGSGKTLVAAHRFGLLRFAQPPDGRAVVAVSFTRAATRELRQRIIRIWGRSALTPPHRVITIDTMLWELLTYLLRAGHIIWPGGHVDLQVMDTWELHADHRWTTYQPYLKLDGRVVTPTAGFGRHRENRVDRVQFEASVRAGMCAHESSPSSGYARVTSRSLRLSSRTPSATYAIARTPSHLNSYPHPDPPGKAPLVASIGGTRFGILALTPRS